MLEVFTGSHCTVTFLCAASYCRVSCWRPALSAAVIAPVFGGSSALMVTDPLPPLPERAAGRAGRGQQARGRERRHGGQGSSSRCLGHCETHLRVSVDRR
jgi:hypothetical protein